MSDMRERIESLSPRQLEIMLCVAQHLSSREIGQALGLSPATVDSHIAAALQKLGLASRRDAAVQMIEHGLVSSVPVSGIVRTPGNHHHGEMSPSNLHGLPAIGMPISSLSPGRDPAELSGEYRHALSPIPIRSGMGRVLVRYLLDAFYITLFFAIMSSVAIGAHWTVVQCEQWKIDKFVLAVLTNVSYGLVLLDAIGVLTATGLLTYRFIRAMMNADD
jgi:DNA-binding CsgD family transcriptional regulator